jgi:polygalacturonase
MSQLTAKSIFVAASFLIAEVALPEEAPPGNFKNPEAVQWVEHGDLEIANAAWWGFDANDSTHAIQEAINSGANKVIIPYMGSDWIVRPIELASNQEIFFEPGVVVLAKKGQFKGTGDCLFAVRNKQNITLIGYGATLRMQKADYMDPAEYKKAEWRMATSFRGCTNIKILGLTLEKSGGDGIYIGSTKEQRFCKEVTIKDVLCNENYRQGISVIGAENLLIENCVFKDTSGTPPAAGIDLEPNGDNERLVNCIIRNCVCENNAGGGFYLYLKHLSNNSPDVSVTFENCYVKSGQSFGLGVGAAKDDGPKGFVVFRNCTVENTKDAGISIWDKSVESVKLRFVNCSFKNVAANDKAPIKIELRRKELVQQHGGIEFANCYIFDNKDRPALLAWEKGPAEGIYDIKGTLNIFNPNGAKIELGQKADDAGLTINDASAQTHQ